MPRVSRIKGQARVSTLGDAVASYFTADGGRVAAQLSGNGPDRCLLPQTIGDVQAISLGQETARGNGSRRWTTRRAEPVLCRPAVAPFTIGSFVDAHPSAGLGVSVTLADAERAELERRRVNSCPWLEDAPPASAGQRGHSYLVRADCAPTTQRQIAATPAASLRSNPTEPPKAELSVNALFNGPALAPFRAIASPSD